MITFRLVLFLNCFIVLINADAQIRYGVKAGLNIADVVINNVVDPDAEADYKSKPGPHAGIFITFDGDQTGFGAELLYSNKGVKAVTNISFHYIAVPLLFRYHLSEYFVAEGGPEIGYLVNASSKHGNLNHIWDNKLDLGLDIGIQYKGLSKIVVGMRFNAGISSVIRNAAVSTGERIRYQNRVLQLSAGYIIGQAKD